MAACIRILRKMLPKGFFGLYHRALAWLAAFAYRHPSRDLIVIGVTGTNGKTSTCYFIAKAFEAQGAKTGMTSTALFKVADNEWMNDTKMTMLGRFRLQKLLREMVDAGCAYAVIETSSQGILQHRHKEIAYDACVFTNLTPEHVEAHGGFENYKKAKIELFRHTASLPPKSIDGKAVPRVNVVNADDEHAKDFMIKGFDRTVTYGFGESAEVRAIHVEATKDAVAFTLGETRFTIHTPGRVMAANALAAVATAEAFGVSRGAIAERLDAVKGMPGRYEFIDEGQPWSVIVDYAYEPKALEALFDFTDTIKENGRIIHVTGSCGGGRDVARREVIGRLSATRAQVTIATNEDPYDDDPRAIIDDVADGAAKAGGKEGETLYRINERGDAIRKAMELAQKGDVVLITGKGSEPVMAVAGGKKIPWDDREEARKAIRERVNK
jgi:UDP-N-acetylmuramoyl-L-alanyl-D-glutamate--2,6-diaminopimelate ligase